MKKMSSVMLSGWITIFLILLSVELFPQMSGGVYLDPNRGNYYQRKKLTLNSNLVESIIKNTGTFGEPNNKDYSGAWPVNSGHGHIQQMTIIVSANVIGADGKEYFITSDSYEDTPTDHAADGKEYFWNPLPGYASDNQYHVNRATGATRRTLDIANSIDTATYPFTWPGKDYSWNKHWNGYFGKDQFNSDQECIYVMDDSYNSEYPYYPFKNDTTRRGLGLQVETRMFQWAHPLAEDEVFIHFQVSNVSDKVYDRNIYFGAFADTHPGGLGASDDNSGYSKDDNFVFAWDNDNRSTEWTRASEVLPGYLGWKYLESPGYSTDGVDNDNDGLIDERRDNDAGSWVYGPVGKYSADKWHWSGDEDGDWSKDLDDVGSDGIGPLDINYVAPDADGTEGNGKPDQGEPNFGKTDKDESDQIGLTSFYSPAYGSMHASEDEQIWNYIQPGIFETPAQNSNNMWVFASGPFKLDQKQSERFSVCWLFGSDRTDIFRNAQVAQKIYDNNYRFTKPPNTPIVTAIPGDKRVTLYWNDIAEKSQDPVYGQDFEGYRIYRGTNPQMSESQVITDGYGSTAYRKWIAEFDLKDGVKGMHPIALGTELGDQYNSGIHYFMGDDVGIRHYFIDTTELQNGVTYYYAVVSYDKGYYPGMDERGLSPMTPAECPIKVGSDDQDPGPNVAIATPNAPAVNYIPGKIENAGIIQTNGTATGSVSVTVIDPDKLPENHIYELSFKTKPGIDDGIGVSFATSYSLRDTTINKFEIVDAPIPFQFVKVDSLLRPKVYDWEKYDTLWASGIYSGMVLNFKNDAPSIREIRASSGWKPGSKTTEEVTFDFGDPAAQYAFPINFKIEFTDDISGQAFTSKQATNAFDVYFNITDTKTGENVPCYLKENLFTKNGKWDETEKLYIGAKKEDGTYIFPWVMDLLKPTPEAIRPQSGDIYQFVSPVPFTNKDKYYFSTKASRLETSNNKSALDKIAVVPNPYVLGASWERATATNGRGERKISFIHLPAECNIKIFTQNGVLLKTIEHTGSMTDGSEWWDLTTDENLEVAFGIYIYHIDAKELGKKTGIFAIIN